MFAFLRSVLWLGGVLGITAAVVGGVLLLDSNMTDSRAATALPASGPLVAAKFLAPVAAQEDAVLGYQIALPRTYRRTAATLGDGQEAFVGRVM